jgi:hypothetical protein
MSVDGKLSIMIRRVVFTGFGWVTGNTQVRPGQKAASGRLEFINLFCCEARFWTARRRGKGITKLLSALTMCDILAGELQVFPEAPCHERIYRESLLAAGVYPLIHRRRGTTTAS